MVTTSRGRRGRTVRRLLAVLGISAMVGLFSIGTPIGSAANADSDAVFATIDGEEIPMSAFENYLAGYVRTQFYHGVDDDRLASIMPEIAESFVRNLLLLREAERRGIAGDPDKVERQIADLEQRYGGHDAWPKVVERLPQIRAELLGDTKVGQLREMVRHVPEPDVARLQRFYEENIELFTIPNQNRLGVILFSVHPSSTNEQWLGAQAMAEQVRDQLVAGANFGEAAAIHSDHESASNDGDMGFLHDGELSAEVQSEVNKLALGEITPAIRVLEGFVILKLLQRVEPQIQPLETVKGRAEALYRRMEAEARWERLIAQLRRQSQVTVHQLDGASSRVQRASK